MSEFIEKRKFLIVTFLAAMTLCNLVMPIQSIPSLQNGFQDFTIYYMAGLLVRSGHAADLYNLETQYRTQLTFAHVPIRQGPLPYNHPAFEAILFVPFTLLGYFPAYIVWTALNLIMLAMSVILLRRQFPQLAAVSPLVLSLGATAFFPVALGIFQGQDVMLLELLFVLAIISLDRGNDATAGAFLAAGLFLPHIIVPVAALFAARSRRVLVGFVPIAAALAGISIVLTGWRKPLEYVQFVLHVEKSGATSYGPRVVPNLRGLITDLPGFSAGGSWVPLLILGLSAGIFLFAFLRIFNRRDSMLFVASLAAVTAILVSYHALSYDLTLLLPLVLLFPSRVVAVGGLKAERMKAGTTRIDWLTMLLLIFLFLTPLYVFLVVVAQRFFLFSLVLLGLYLMLVLEPDSSGERAAA
jgi:hypothetical protein